MTIYTKYIPTHEIIPSINKKSKKFIPFIPFVYVWIHKSGKWYIGSHTSKKSHPFDGYICSSKIVKPLIVKSPNEWHRVILNTGNAREMYDFETKLLQMFNAMSDANSYNQHNNTSGFNNYDFIGEHWNKGSKGKHCYNNGIKNIVVTPDKVPEGYVKGRLMPPEELKRLSETMRANVSKGPSRKGKSTGKHWYTNGKDSAVFGIGSEPEGYYPGRAISDEKRKQISNTLLGNVPWNKGKKSGMKWYNNGDKCTMFKVGEEPEGYIPGRKITKVQNDGRLWYNNGSENRRFFEGKQRPSYKIGKMKKKNK